MLGGLLLAPRAPAQPTAYEAQLSVRLTTNPDLCAEVPCRDVLPAATHFSNRMGHPAYVEGYRGEAAARERVGYVFLSTDVVDIPAYSGKPVVTLIGMDSGGIITGIRILRHSEPILLVGIPESELTRFVAQYVGRFVGDRIEIGRGRTEQGQLGVDAISGATVTVIAENQVILRSGYQIARQLGIVQGRPRPPASFAPAGAPRSWQQLRRDGGVQRLLVTPAEIGADTGGQPYIEMYFGLLNAPEVGLSILGAEGQRRLLSELPPGEHALFIAANGAASFKGSGFVRGGIYDRIQVTQEADSYTFRDTDYRNLYELGAAGAPAFRESGIFIIRDATFSAAYPWRLVFLGNRVDRETGQRTFASFDREYWLADRYLAGGRPDYQRPPPGWLRIWRERPLEIGLFLLWLGAAALLYANRERLARRASHRDDRWVAIPKHLMWLLAVGFGFWLLAQPSITQVLTWFHALLFEWRWELFLTDRFIFLFWMFVIATTFFWGRGLFCGWLCPYGALTGLAHSLAGRLGLARLQRRPPQWLHDRLQWLKYFVFAALLAGSFYSMGLAERLAEVEPFKTTFLVGVWNRSWPFVTFWLLLFVAALFFERPFCKYLCPLGASLAVPSTFRWWGLRRKAECGPCTACEQGCASLAIDSAGRIDQRECLLCLDCTVLYFDVHACPPLALERKRRERAGQPLTPIGRNGYFVPLQPLAPAPAPAAPRPGLLLWLATEIFDHLIPWGGRFRLRPLVVQAGSIALAVLVTWAWLLGAAGKLGPGIILGWWLAWSVYETFARMHCKPRVKEGPWWQRNYRPASWPDMMAYVGMKNLLIGAALFLFLKAVGVLQFLQGLPELEWLYR